MNKKILFVLHLPPPVHGSSMVGQFIKDSTLINSNFDSKYINLSTSKTVDEIGKKPFVKITRYIKILGAFFIGLIKFKPDTIYLAINAKGIGFYKDFPIALLTKLFGVKLVLHYHNKGISKIQDCFLDNLLYKFLFRNTKIILLSKSLFTDVKKYVKEENVFYCPNGIPQVMLPKRISLKNDEIAQLLFLSNLIESKGVFVLLEALKLLKTQGIKFQCNLVGGEGDISSNELEEKLEDLNLTDCVFYLGKKYGKDKYKIFQKSDVFILPTYYHNECFPLVLLEAMQFGLPIISTNEGGLADIVENNETGFIVEKQNPTQLAVKITWLIKNTTKAKAMGEKGRDKFYKKYTIEFFEQRFIEILNQI
jgi:glycosyltransferase involved in cell wall biosynthesis